MYMNEKTIPVMKYLLRLLFPDGCDVDVQSDGNVQIQAHTQAAVRAVRACFPGVIWQKQYSACDWWEYNGKVGKRMFRPAFKIHIYACREAPPTCHAVVEKVEVEELVPVGADPRPLEKRIVVKEKTRWVCSDNDKVEGASA
jgi:hypothetical protein